jgi:MFS family permease
MSAMVLANIAGHMYEPLLPLYLQSLGAGVAQVGLFFTLGAVAPLAFQILGGWLSDSLGRLRAVALGSLAGSLGWVVLLIAPTWGWLLISTVLGSMARAFVGPSYQAFIAEQSTEANRGRVYGATESLFRVVGVVGPPIGGYLSQHFGFQAMLIVAAALYTTATVARLLMARGTGRPAPSASQAPAAARPTFAGFKASLAALVALLAAGGAVTWILISDGIRDGMWNLSFQLEPLYLQNIGGLTNVEIGWLVSIASLTTMLTTGVTGWLSDRRGERVGIASGFLLVAAGMVVVVNSRAFPGFALAWLMYGLGEALLSPAYSSLISKTVPERLRGIAFGVFSTSIGVLALPMPYLGAQLWERVNPRAPFYAVALATLALVPIIWVKFKLPKPEPVQPVESSAWTS